MEPNTRNSVARLLTAAAASCAMSLAFVSMTGCDDNDTPGEAVDEAIDETGDAMDEVGDDIEDAADDAADEIDDATDDEPQS